MISLKLNRFELQLVQAHFFPFIKLAKTTRIKNVAHCSLQSREHLTVLAVNCITDEIMLAINKKLINTGGNKIKLKFSDAQAVIFMELLNSMPLTADNFYLWNLRNAIVDLLDREITSVKIYSMGLVMNG